MLKKIFSFITWPFRQVWEIISFICMDLTKDLRTSLKLIKDNKEGKKVFDPEKVKEFKLAMKQFTPANLLKEYWLFLLVCVFCLAVGYSWGLAVCNVECNNFINTEILSSPYVTIAESADQLNFNISKSRLYVPSPINT